MALTNKQVQHAKPGRHIDGKGLYLLVKPTGSKSWVLRVQHQGERRDFGIGSFSPVSVAPDLPLHRRSSLTLEEARTKAREGRELAKAGINPNQHWRAKDATVIPIFEDAAREVHAHNSKGWRKGKHGAQWLSTLKTYAFPHIGNLPVDQIDAPDLQKLLMPIWLSKPETARRARPAFGATTF